VGIGLLAEVTQILLNSQAWVTIMTSVHQQLPEEACGMLAGYIKENVVSYKKAYPCENILHSPTRFRMDPEEQIATIFKIENEEMHLLGTYHSHPNGPAFPSRTDLEEWYDPKIPALICSQEEGGWVCKAFSLRDGAVIGIPIFIEADS
jgi:proteasome lid subunit RPN8/RPN11